MDVVSKEVRSKMMSAVRHKDTKPEITVRKYIHSLGFRFRLHKRIGPTRPDITLSKWNFCIFVHGCYWHRHKECKLASTPKTNKMFWEKKFQENTARDQKNISHLNSNGWKVLVIWECSIRDGSFKKALNSHLLSLSQDRT